MIDCKRITNDINGNSRFVIHFLSMLSDNEQEIKGLDKYAFAVYRANKIGGRKYHTKAYGGGIVFTAEPKDVLPLIDNLKDSTEVAFYDEHTGDTLAVFPGIIEDERSGAIACYSHVGQHSQVTKDYLRRCKRLKRWQSVELQKELTRIGYKLDII